MKKMIGVVLAVVAVCGVALAWDDVNRTISKLQSETITASGVITAGSFSGAVSAASLTAGTSATAINGAAITNLTAANIRAGGVLPAVSGAAVTNLNPANLSGSKMTGIITNNLALTNYTFVVNGIIVSNTLFGTP